MSSKKGKIVKKQKIGTNKFNATHEDRLTCNDTDTSKFVFYIKLYLYVYMFIYGYMYVYFLF